MQIPELTKSNRHCERLVI